MKEALRSILRPLDPLPPRQLEPQDDTEDGFSVYESPCLFQVSNDEYTPADIDKIEICDILFYGGCITDPGEFNATGSLQLNMIFDYELHYAIGANLTRAVAFLEAAIVEHIASATGLANCGTRNRLLQGVFSDADLARFEAVSAEPADELDTEWGK
jgi:hypothetical protein